MRLALTAILCALAFHYVPEDCPEGYERPNWVTVCVRHMQGSYRPHCDKWEKGEGKERCIGRRWVAVARLQR